LASQLPGFGRQKDSQLGVAITGWGSALPEKVVTNDDLALYLDTSDEWITERTGIKERRIGGTTGELAIDAARNAMRVAGLSGDDIDLVILATSTPDQTMPATAAVVQNALQISGGAMDINVACSGFVYGTALAHGMVLGGARNVLVIGADTLSRITDQADRTTAVLFADGAGAVIVSKTDGADQLLAGDLGSDGSLKNILQADYGGYIEMNGKEVYRQAVLMVIESVNKTCAEAKIAPTDIDLFVAHQANARIIYAVMDRLNMPHERAAIILDRTGNTSAASIPLALNDAIDHNMVEDGDNVMLCGFGAGMSWATQIWKWGR
jgi:3-oxoacyl-[acyl-carrier-protein] synthase III